MLLGVDEAGRGPFLGPLVVAGVLVTDDGELRALGVRDSKRLTPKRRAALAPRIREVADGYAVVVVPVERLNEELPVRTLDDVTFTAFVEVIRRLRPAQAVVDTCGPPAAWANRLRAELDFECHVTAEVRADDTHPVVSAASILAKVERDEAMAVLESQHGPVGSGYPSDARTIAFAEWWIAQHGALPPFARKTWATGKRLRGLAPNLQS